MPPLNWNELSFAADWVDTGMPPTNGMPFCCRTSMLLPKTSIPPSTAGTFSPTKRWPHAVEPSAVNLVLHTSRRIGWPSMPPSSALTQATAAWSAWDSSGNDTAGVFSWLTMPSVIGVPVALVALAGTYLAIVERRAHCNSFVGPQSGTIVVPVLFAPRGLRCGLAARGRGGTRHTTTRAIGHQCVRDVTALLTGGRADALPDERCLPLAAESSIGRPTVKHPTSTWRGASTGSPPRRPTRPSGDEHDPAEGLTALDERVGGGGFGERERAIDHDLQRARGDLVEQVGDQAVARAAS